jgi:hypothetical protein
MSRRTPPADDVLLCEECGYTLVGLPTSANCPECGRPIALSQPGASRRPTAWETRGSLRAFIITAADVLLHPRSFFTRMSIEPSRHDFGFLLMSLVVAGFLVGLTVALHGAWLMGFFSKSIELSRAIPAMFGLLGLGKLITILAGMALIRTIAWLSQLEANYWGMRLWRDVARRGLCYHAAAFIPVALVALAFVATNFAMSLEHRNNRTMVSPTLGIPPETYLYVLSGIVLASAGYLFYTYATAMRALMRANRPVASGTPAGTL